ncbi:glycine zipper 2TM domain-containing protein [Qipengyuania sp. XHP0207]|uniref:glycine zipper 2TM domain-containing protein n=1 Tax=Qipengyuania sp. XHP0207 TaxID=3038078 RepID=UPI00241ED720|nr:glycine zipper 2TM domain-containing protein [Qipengyuania sp. XHP0207]MDG5748364.1 glycine zipper 2TM domain-containing protein [Qipengyuania sp. XHP0207]
MRKTVLANTLGLALGAGLLAAPAQAIETSPAPLASVAALGDLSFDHRRDRWDDDDWDDDDRYERRRYRDRYYGRQGRYYDEPVYRNTRVWRGRDGRTYCRKKDGTTGLIIGGAVGALLGREIDTRGDRSLGTILGAAGGAILGREVARGRARCR